MHVADIVRLLKAENVEVVMDGRVPIGASAAARRTPNGCYVVKIGLCPWGLKFEKSL